MAFQTSSNEQTQLLEPVVIQESIDNDLNHLNPTLDSDFKQDDLKKIDSDLLLAQSFEYYYETESDNSLSPTSSLSLSPVSSTLSETPPKPSVTISQAKTNDISAIHNFLSQTLSSSFGFSFLFQHLYKSSHFLLIATVNNNNNESNTENGFKLSNSKPIIVGVVAGHLQSSRSTSAYLSILSVDPDHRRCGIASSLLASLETLLRQELQQKIQQSPKQKNTHDIISKTIDNVSVSDETSAQKSMKISNVSKTPKKPFGWSVSFVQQAVAIEKPEDPVIDGELSLDVETSNFQAQAFYAKHGFVLSGPEKKGYYQHNGKSSFLMKKTLL